MFEGAAAPIGSDSYTPEGGSVVFHGVNGLGEVDFKFSKRVKSEKTAVEFISEAIEKYGQELTLVPTGPLTNLMCIRDSIKAANNTLIPNPRPKKIAEQIKSGPVIESVTNEVGSCRKLEIIIARPVSPPGANECWEKKMLTAMAISREEAAMRINSISTRFISVQD